jgi:hypothetical protein
MILILVKNAIGRDPRSLNVFNVSTILVLRTMSRCFISKLINAKSVNLNSTNRTSIMTTLLEKLEDYSAPRATLDLDTSKIAPAHSAQQSIISSEHPPTVLLQNKNSVSILDNSRDFVYSFPSSQSGEIIIRKEKPNHYLLMVHDPTHQPPGTHYSIIALSEVGLKQLQRRLSNLDISKL